MAVTPPTRGQRDWDDEMATALNALDAASQAAVAESAAARSDAAYAKNRADEVHTAVVGGADVATAGFVDDDNSASTASIRARVAADIPDAASDIGSALSDTFVGQAEGGVVDTAPAVGGLSSFVVESPHVHNAFPSIARRADGTLVGVFRGGTAHASLGGVIRFTTSADGKTWAPTTVIDTSDVVGATDARDPAISVLANGDVLVAWYDAGPRESYWKRSTDGGATWSASTLIPFGYDDLNFISAPVVELPSGRWLATAYCRNAADAASQYRIVVVASDDAGTTWNAPVTVTGVGFFYEPNIISTGGNNALMLIRGSTSIRRSTTTDQGDTWTANAFAFTGTGNPHAVRFSSGAIACIYRDTEHGGAMTRTSRDGGVTWSSRATQFGESLDRMVYGAAVEVEPGRAVMLWGSEDTGTKSTIIATTLSESPGLSRFGAERSGLDPWAIAEPINEIFVPASAFTPTSGSPALGTVWVNGPALMMYDAAAVEQAAATVQLPNWWKSFDVELLVAPTDASGGVVKWEMSYRYFVVGSTVSTSGTLIDYGGITMPAVLGQLAGGRIASNLETVDTHGYFYFRVIRNASHAADVYPADAGLFGLRIIRKS